MERRGAGDLDGLRRLKPAANANGASAVVKNGGRAVAGVDKAWKGN